MSPLEFTEARREQMKLRMANLGVSGAGKTRGALEIATNLYGGELKVAGIDTEHGRMKLFADRYKFQHAELVDHHPNSWIDAIDSAEGQGAEVIICDSFSHEWVGKNGTLQLADRFGAWKEVRPLHTSVLERIASSQAHIICCIRSKMKYGVTMEPRASGQGERQVIEKLGLGPVQDDAIIYEFDVLADVDIATHEALFSNRCDPLVGKTMMLDAAVAEILTSWLSEGEPPVIPEEASQEEISKLIELLQENGITSERIESGLASARSKSKGVLTPEYVREQVAKQEQLRDAKKETTK